MQTFSIYVIIAISNNRINLFAKALKSVYMQKIPLNMKQNIKVILSCDDCTREQKEIIHKNIEDLRKAHINDTFLTQVIDNTRTKGHSGTGAWNSAAFLCLSAYTRKEQCFLAFLDDDDSWEEEYLQACIDILTKHDNIGLIASGIFYHQDGKKEILLPNKDTLQREHVFIQNPYIQGSNLFINLEVFFSLGCFDESMPSTTDRDLIMRYLEYIQVKQDIQTKFIYKPLVHHFADNNRERVTTNMDKKHKGLEQFYRKYSHDFQPNIQEQSLKRAKECFGFIKNNKDLSHNENLMQPIQTNNVVALNRMNLILAFSCFDSNNAKKLINSFVKLKPHASKALNDLKICVLTTQELQPILQNIFKPYTFKFYIKSLKKCSSIAISRTKLQLFAYKIGTHSYGKNFVTWIIDDDLRFYGFDGIQKYKIDYFSHISRYVNDNIDCVFGGVVGQPSIPFLSTLRTQLLDLLYALKPHTKTINESYGEYYYDLSSKDFSFLEYPFLDSMNPKNIIRQLQKGCVATRKLAMQQNKIGCIQNDSIYRGGNSIIYNPDLLKLPNFTPYKGYNRRSDFNWAITHKILHGYTLKNINLPLWHMRKEITLNLEYQKIKNDFIGMVFYRVFMCLCESYTKEFLSYGQAQEMFDKELQLLKTKIIANLYRIESLDILIAAMIPTEMKNPYKDLSKKIQKSILTIKKFCKKKQTLDLHIYEICKKYINSKMNVSRSVFCNNPCIFESK